MRLSVVTTSVMLSFLMAAMTVFSCFVLSGHLASSNSIPPLVCSRRYFSSSSSVPLVLPLNGHTLICLHRAWWSTNPKQKGHARNSSDFLSSFAVGLLRMISSPGLPAKTSRLWWKFPLSLNLSSSLFRSVFQLLTRWFRQPRFRSRGQFHSAWQLSAASAYKRNTLVSYRTSLVHFHAQDFWRKLWNK